MPIHEIINERHTDNPLLWLVTFRTFDDMPVLRGVNNLEDIVSRGKTYKAFPFGLTLPPDDGKKPTSVTLTISNVGRELIELLRGYSPDKTPQITLELVTGHDPDTVEKNIDFLTIASANYDALQITLTLASHGIFGRPTCSAKYTQAEFPGMFFGIR